MRHSLYLVLVFFIFSVMIGPGCSQVQKGEATNWPVKVKVLVLPFLSFAPFFIADQEGYFSEQGLEVEFVRLDRGTEAISAFVQDNLDVYAGAINIGILKAMQNADIRRGYGTPVSSIMLSRISAESHFPVIDEDNGKFLTPCLGSTRNGAAAFGPAIRAEPALHSVRAHRDREYDPGPLCSCGCERTA